MIVDLFFLNRVSKGTVSENKLGHVKIVPEVIESFSPQNDNTKYIDIYIIKAGVCLRTLECPNPN